MDGIHDDLLTQLSKFGNPTYSLALAGSFVDLGLEAEARSRPAFGWTDNRRHFTGAEFLAHVDRAVAVP